MYKNLILPVLFILTSCMDEHLDKISTQVIQDTQIAVPLIQSSITMFDLLPLDEHIVIDDDNFIRIIYSRDSFASVSSDSLLDVENQAPTSRSMSLGAIEIEDYTDEFRMTILQLSQNIEDTVLGGYFPTGVAYSDEHGSAFFPPIVPQSAGYYSRPGPDAFKFVVVETGLIEISLINEMPVEITRLDMTLMNRIDSSVVGKFYFENIPVDGIQTDDLYIENQDLYSDLLMFVDTFFVEGSGNNPFDQSTFVPLSYAQGVDVIVTTRNFIVKEGLVRFPEREGPSDTIVVDLEFENGMELSRMDVDEGDFNCNFESSVKTDIDVEFTIPQLKNEFGEVFTFSFIVSNTEQSGIQNSTFPIDGFDFDLSQNLNTLDVYFSTKVVPTPVTQDHVVFSELDTVRISVALDNMEFSYIEGYFGQVEKIIEPSEFSLDLNALQEIATGIVLETPKITFISDNSMGIPFDINLTMEGVNNGMLSNLDGPPIEINANGISYTEYNSANSQIVDFIALNPKKMQYSGDVISNPQGDTGALNFISPGSGLTIGFEMDLPLHLRIEDTNLSDTLNISLELPTSIETNIDDYLVSAQLFFSIENEFPFDANVMLYFKDSISNYNLDSLELNLIEAAQVNSEGIVENASVLNYSILLAQERLLNLLDVNQVVLNANFSSYDYENTAVKLYTDYELRIGLGILNDLQTE